MTMNMKRNYLCTMTSRMAAITATILMLSMTSCKAQKDIEIAPKGEVRTVQLAPFTSIRNAAAVRLHYTQGDKQLVRVKESPNWHLKLSVKGKVLVMEIEDKTRNGNIPATDVWITAPKLTDITNSNALYVDYTQLTSEQLTLDNSGAMSLYAGKTDCGSLSIDNSGSLRISTSVKADNFCLDNTGALTDSLSIACQQMVWDNNGSQKTQCNAECSGEGRMNNSGSLRGSITIGTPSSLNIDNQGSINAKMTLEAATMTLQNNGMGKQDMSFKGGDLTISNSGNAKINLQVDCNRIKATNYGISQLTVAGMADDTQFESKGISKIDASNLNKF